MAWLTPPAPVTTGDLITAAVWNQRVHDNVTYLKGQAPEASGHVEFETGLRSDTAETDDLGSSAIPWRDIFIARRYEGGVDGSYHVTPSVREERITWEVRDQNASSQPDVQVAYRESGAGFTVREGGSGQVVIKIDNDATGEAGFEQLVEQNNAISNHWDDGKDPYWRMEFALSLNDSRTRAFIGFRTTPGAALPVVATEHHAGIFWNGTIWQTATGDGSAQTVTAITVAAGARHVIEISIDGGTDVRFYLDGVLVATHTGNLPTDDLEWAVLLDNPTGGGAADDSHMTCGEVVVQELLA